MKWLVLLGVLAAFYLIWRHQRQGERSSQDGARPGAGASQPPGAARAAATGPQEMVRCPTCGLHLPREDAVADAAGHLYCSPQHRDRPTP